MENPNWLQPLQETADQLQMDFLNEQEMLMRKLMASDRVKRVYNPKLKLHRITLYDPLHSVPVVFDIGGDGAAKQEEETAKSRYTSLATALPVPTKASVVPSPQSKITRFSVPSSTPVQPLPGLDGIDPKLANAAAASRSSVPCKDADAAVPGAERKERKKSLFSTEVGTAEMRSSQRKSTDFAVLGGTTIKRKSSIVPALIDSESAVKSSKAAESNLVALVTTRNVDRKISLSPIGFADLAAKMSDLAEQMSGSATNTLLLIAQSSSSNTKTSDSAAKTSDPAPKRSVPAPKMSAPAPKLSVPTPKMSIPTPKMSFPAPQMSVPTAKTLVPIAKSSDPAGKIF